MKRDDKESSNILQLEPRKNYISNLAEEVEQPQGFNAELGLNGFNRKLLEVVAEGRNYGLTPHEIVRRVKELGKESGDSTPLELLRPVDIADYIDEHRRAEKLAEIDSEQVFSRHALFKGDRPLIIVAQSGIGKSTLLIQEAMLWTVGRGFLLTPAKPLRVLILETEEHKSDYFDIVPGVVKYAKGQGIDFDLESLKSQLRIYSVSGLHGEQLISTLEALIDESFEQGQPFDLIVLNPALSFLGGDASSQETVSQFLRQDLDPLIKRQNKEVGLCLIHHTKKVNQDTTSYAANDAMYATHGSAEWTNASRTVVTLQYYQRNVEGVYVAYAAKRGNALGWKDSKGNPTSRVIIGHAPKVDEDGNPTYDRYWRYLTQEEVDEISEQTKTETKADKIAGYAEACIPWFDSTTVMQRAVFSEKCVKEFKLKQDKDKIVREIIKDLEARGHIEQAKFGKEKSFWLGRKRAIEQYKEQQRRK